VPVLGFIALLLVVWFAFVVIVATAALGWVERDTKV
jgi:hypothetical protein